MPEPVVQPIPEAWWKAASEALERDFGDVSFRMVDGEAQVAVIRAVAPVIDRAARIDELKRLLGEQEDARVGWADHSSQVVRVDDIEARIAELERESHDA